MRKLGHGMKTLFVYQSDLYRSNLSYFSGVTRTVSAFNFLIRPWEKIWEFKTYFLLY